MQEFHSKQAMGVIASVNGCSHVIVWSTRHFDFSILNAGNKYGFNDLKINTFSEFTLSLEFSEILL